MATKYTGQTALNKLMQLMKTALNNKADKSALDEKLDKSGGTITGGLNVNGSLDVDSTLSTDLMVMTPSLVVHDEAKEVAIYVNVAGDNAAKVTSPVSGGGTQYARLAVGTPTGDNDATPKAYVDTKVSGLQTASQVQDAIRRAITGVYTPKGSIAFASLPVPVAGKVGWVYNIKDAFTTNSNFVEGEGFDYPAGTNVVCAEISAGDYGWDVLAGTIDLTELTATEVQTLWDSN
jgi:hypothetical protein